MKRKLKIVLFLIALSVTGIIIFQGYWSFNAYKENKKLFETKIDEAMQRALDSCKRDYFDSIRTVLVKRLSESTTVIKIDSPSQINTAAVGGRSTFSIGPLVTPYAIWISVHGSKNSSPFQTSSKIYNYYRSKINHRNATVPEVLTEMSFYVPPLMTELIQDFFMYDGTNPPPAVRAYIEANYQKPGFKYPIEQSGIFEQPSNYKQADSLKIGNYLRAELAKIHINAPFAVNLASTPTASRSDHVFFSETNEYKYQYHGFTFLLTNYTLQPRYTLYARAAFRNPQYVVIKGMLITLSLSALLVLFTIFSFYYIIRIINQQKALGELKDDFINNMTHELKTPIATITVAIEGLQKFNALNDPEKTQRYLQTSRNELARLNELVSKVLDVAAFENKEITLVKERLKVDDLVNELIAVEKSKTEKALTITYNNNAGIDLVTADKLHFKNVMLNILDNAVKYSNEPAAINITLDKGNNMAVFTIKDNGIGIPAAHINRVFEKFYRVPTGNVHNVKGTGLGLNYVRYIVEAHGGLVAVKSELNVGSEFTVSIPL
ncbi:sensor histidine kinase [Mucilaginibacter sp. FT3.2]|uniref:sensor histidine kinase n=1 Tax=Mucilaginibacter sp. FT3.2 TaxID=2723090 RepID=UPI00161041F5|nr:HAMP domain-containing sensor histidine kinase [Mucilaginibacter sp. FT3.2]MBB6231829.1 signal transduction histidine kinase [Mucilaginibacter sp. FT3.2]